MRFIGKWYLFFWKLLHQLKKMMFISVDLWHKNEGFFFIELWRKNVIFQTHWDDRWSQLRLGLPFWAGQFFYEKFSRPFWFAGFETHGSSSDSSESLNSSLSTSASAMSSPLPQFDSHKKHAAPAVPGNPQLSNVSGLRKLLLLPHTDCHNLVILLNM